MRFVLFLGLCVAFLGSGCGDSGPEDTAPDGGPNGTPAALTHEKANSLLVGTWDDDMKYPSGDVVPCVRVLAADGTGSQYAQEAAPTRPRSSPGRCPGTARRSS